jgi:hypothetical protein
MGLPEDDREYRARIDHHRHMMEHRHHHHFAAPKARLTRPTVAMNIFADAT